MATGGIREADVIAKRRPRRKFGATSWERNLLITKKWSPGKRVNSE